MLDLVNKTPYRAVLVPGLDKDGSEFLVVVVKATFAIARAGELRFADEQRPIALADAHYGEPGSSSVRIEADTALRKPGVDVVLLGTAHAAHGTESLDVELRVGPIHKVGRVFGPRHWTKASGGYRPSSPRKFVQAPLVWERAFGGADPPAASGADAGPPQRSVAYEERNPVGVGFVGAQRTAHDLEGRPLPQIEDPSQLLQRPGERPAPFGFGFVARSWYPRSSLVGTLDAAWSTDRAPLLPLDFDDRFFHSAPSDQLLREVRGGEACSVTNVLPGGRPLGATLPRLAVDVEVIANRRSATHRARVDTVIIDADSLEVAMVCRAAIPVGRKLLAIDRLKIREAA